jgi:hypothetical protein
MTGIAEIIRLSLNREAGITELMRITGITVITSIFKARRV